MHSNHVLNLSSLSNAALQHYGLDMGEGATLKAQCFFNDNNEVTDITWAGQIIVAGMPYWRNIAALVLSSINQDKLASDILKLSKVTSTYAPIQEMHKLAEKYDSRINLEC